MAITLDFAHKTALVTGGTRGIGLAIATALREAGAKVIVTGSSGRDGLKVDFKDEKATERFAETIVSENIDILINNAGINKIDAVGDIKTEDWDAIHAVNLRAPFVLMRALAPAMAKRGYGRIVNISSVFGHVSKSQRASYSSSKHGLLGLTQAAALDYAQSGILVNALAPGFIDTELTRTVLTPAQIKDMVAAVPLGRLGTPEEIATVALFLASSSNTFITGQSIVADGGFTCG
jgi:3-oxoacyl-[acyl-carrier protein] reductase